LIHGLDLEAGVALPLPLADANRDVIGIGARLGLTVRVERTVGIGVDLGHYYWPVSERFKQRFDHELRQGTLNTLRTGEGTWGMQVFHVGGHIRASTSGANRVRPWFRVGAGVYRVDPNISGYRGDAGLFSVSAPPWGRTSHLGGSIALGAELSGHRAFRLGLDATYHVVACDRSYASNPQILTIGITASSAWVRAPRSAMNEIRP